MKKKEERTEKQMNEVMAENKRLVEPLNKAREEVDELRRQLANYEKDKQSLAVSREDLWWLCKHIHSILWQCKLHLDPELIIYYLLQAIFHPYREIYGADIYFCIQRHPLAMDN